MDNKNLFRGLGIGGALLLIVGCFLPVASVSLFGMSESITLFNEGEGDGIIVIPLAIIAAGLALWGKFRWMILPGVLSLLIVIYDWGNINDVVALFDIAKVEVFGWLVLTVGALLVIAGGVLSFVAGRKSAAMSPKAA